MTELDGRWMKEEEKSNSQLSEFHNGADSVLSFIRIVKIGCGLGYKNIKELCPGLGKCEMSMRRYSHGNTR